MDAEELIRKCEAITLQSEEDNMISFGRNMKVRGERLVAHCLVGKILQTRSVPREGLRAAMQQAWRTTKETKVESLGDNIFLFKFASESEKKRILFGGPWHFDRSLMVVTEPMGIGDAKKQDFTHALFWVQIHNIPIMCMDKEIIQEIGGRIGKVQEVETDDAGECMGSFVRVRIMVNVTRPLPKRLLLKLEDGGQISLRIAYEKLPDFCFCCGLIGHQAERARQARDKDRGNEDKEPSNTALGSQEQQEQIQKNTGRANLDESGGGSKSTQTNMGISSNPMRDSQVEEVGGGALNGERLKQIDCNKFAAKTEVKQLHREESTVEGKTKENKRENKLLVAQGIMDSMGREENTKERVIEGQQEGSTSGGKKETKSQSKVKGKKWKFQAKERAMTEMQNIGPVSLKRSMTERRSPSPKSKKLRMESSIISRANQTLFSSTLAELRMEREEETQMGMHIGETAEEMISVEAGEQPRRQP
ncbi:hypothetical protein WN943_016477 [Citrus x changshan-huyou]